MDAKTKYIINYGIEKYYSRYGCLHYKPLEKWKEEIYNDERIKNIQQSTSLNDIAKIVSSIFEVEIEKRNEKSTISLEKMINESELEPVEDKITMTTEIPKVNKVKKNNKGIAALLSIVLGILVVIGMILVTLISYTIIK